MLKAAVVFVSSWRIVGETFWRSGRRAEGSGGWVLGGEDDVGSFRCRFVELFPEGGRG